jgi:hypothetical protein
VYSTVSISETARPFIDPLGIDPVNIEMAANTGSRKVMLNFDKEIIAYAEKTYAAFPAIPVHAVDLVREESTGVLYVLEINPVGMSWHISSDVGLEVQRQYALDFSSQFGALQVIARTLVETVLGMT